MKNADLPIAPVMMKQTGESDFRAAKDKEILADNYIIPTAGLSKREYFAGLAMQGLLANIDSDKYIVEHGVKTDSGINKAKFCVMMADALLEALEPKTIASKQKPDNLPDGIDDIF